MRLLLLLPVAIAESGIVFNVSVCVCALSHVRSLSHSLCINKRKISSGDTSSTVHHRKGGCEYLATVCNMFVYVSQ